MNNPVRRVVITGLGPVTSVGVGVEAFWSAVSTGRTNVGRRSLAVDLGRTAELPMASMPDAAQVPGLQDHLAFIQEQSGGAYRDLGYAMVATELALADAGVQYDRQSNNIGVIQAFEAPGVERAVAGLFGLFTQPPPTEGPPPVYDRLAPAFYNMQPFMYVHLLGKALGLHGYSTSVHNACASGAFALEAAAQLIRSGQAEMMIVTGGEAFETAVRLEWFRRLSMYGPDEKLRPFDSEAKGFFVGEGGAAIVLESADHAAGRGAAAYGEYLGGAFAHQGWKQTIPDVRSARLAETIDRALNANGMVTDEIDLIGPHGAGTPLSDGYEAACLARALKPGAPRAVATGLKPYVGHMLATSNIIELIAMLLAMRHQTVPATLHTEPDRVDLCVPLITETTQRPLEAALKLATGFTGHDAALLFRRSET
ncbi:MAG: hypothetical protein GY778_05930 [bacterium]|nr:hypothetical protein [bacterium]